MLVYCGVLVYFTPLCWSTVKSLFICQVAHQVASEVDLATRARTADEVAQLHQQLGRELLNRLQMQLDVQLGL